MVFSNPLLAQLRLVNINEKVGMESPQGQIAISPIYQNLGWPHRKDLFKESVIGYQLNGLWGLMDSTGRRITQPIYSHIEYWGNGKILVNQNIRARRESINGIINPLGQIIIPLEYFELKYLSPNIIIAKKKIEGIIKSGIIDSSNTAILGLEYTQITPFENELLLVSKLQGQTGLYHLEQKRFISELVFDSLVILKPQHFLAYQNGWAKLMNHQGHWLLSDAKPRIVNTDSGIYYRDFVNWEIISANNTLVKKLAFDYLEVLNPEVYLSTQSGQQAFVNNQGVALHPYVDKIQIRKSHEYHLVKKDDLWGLMNVNGQFLLNPEFVDIKVFNAFIGVYNGRAWEVYNKEGKLIIDQEFEEILPDSEGMLPVKKRGKWGFVDQGGEQIIPCIYESVEAFQSGLSQVLFYGAKGLINSKGRWVLLPSYQSIEVLTSNIFLTRNATNIYAIQDSTKTYFESKDRLSLYGAYLLKTTSIGKKGLNTWLGKELLPEQYDSISPVLNDSIMIVYQDRKIGVVNLTGRFLIPVTNRFQAIEDFNEGLLAVKIDGNQGFVDLEAKLRIANRYQEVRRFQEGLAPVKIRGQWALINTKEQLISQPVFDWIEGFYGGLSLVRKGNQFGLIDNKGRPTVALEYDSILRTQGGYFISYKNNKIGVLDTEGKLVISNKFDSFEDMGNGLFKVSRRNKFGIVDQLGLNVIPIIYDVISPSTAQNQFLTLIKSGWKKL